jgi:hypothetical protein
MARKVSKLDDKAMSILKALKNKVRPYRDADICVATKLSKRVVWKRLDQLKAAGLVEEVWIGQLPAQWKLVEEKPAIPPVQGP